MRSTLLLLQKGKGLHICGHTDARQHSRSLGIFRLKDVARNMVKSPCTVRSQKLLTGPTALSSHTFLMTLEAEVSKMKTLVRGVDFSLVTFN